MASPISHAEWATSTIRSATCAEANTASRSSALKWPRTVASLDFGSSASITSNVGAMNSIRISSAWNCVARSNGKAVQLAIEATTQEIGVSVRRRLSIIFQRDSDGIAARRPKM